MRILFASNGSNLYTIRFLRKMVDRGYDVHLISYWPYPFHNRVEGATTLHFDLGIFSPLGRRLMRANMTWVLGFVLSLHFRQLLRAIAPDLLHTGVVTHHGFYGALTGFHPTLLMPWGSDILVHPDQSPMQRWMVRFAVQRADMITCDCQLVKDTILKMTNYPPDKIVIFPWGIDLNIFQPSQELRDEARKALGWEENKILIMTRSFYPIYGIEYFIEALPHVVATHPETRVIMAGAGPLEHEHKQRVQESGLSDVVYWAGNVDESRMAKYLNAADIYVTSSLSDGTSASLLEAMACRLPVVVSDAPAYFEWVEDGVNGHIVPRRDVPGLAQRTIHLLGDASLRRAMGQRNYEIAHHRADWEVNFDKLEGIYRTLVEGSCGGY